MKRLNLFIIFMFVGMVTVYSNSMPVRWEEFPSSVMVSVDPATEIAVRGELLSFDFDQGTKEDFSYEGMVTAVYEMENTAVEDALSNMVFPVIGSIGETPEEEIYLEADLEPLDVEIFYGEDVDESEDLFASLKAENILEQFHWESYEPENFRWNDQVRCYTFHVDTLLQELNFQIEWENGDNQTVFVSGFNGYQFSEDGRISLSSRIRLSEEVLEIYTIGEPLEFAFSGEVIEDGTRQSTDAFHVDIETKFQDVESFFTGYMEQIAFEQIGKEDVEEHLDFYARELDGLLERSPNFVMEDDLMQIIQEDRYILLAYQVPFKSGQIRQVSVTYPAKGTMDRSKTVSPTYTYQYLLSPAENWKSFENLSVIIDPPEDAPYVIDSSLDLERLEDGTYTANLKELPEENLFFTLYEKERITLWETIKGFINHRLLGLSMLGVFLAAILGGIILLRIIYKLIAGIKNKRK